jgi:hypothetical protein
VAGSFMIPLADAGIARRDMKEIILNFVYPGWRPNDRPYPGLPS